MNLYKKLKSNIDVYREKLNGKQLPKPRKSGHLQKKSLVIMENNLSQFLKDLESKVDNTDPNASKENEIAKEKQKTKNAKLSLSAINRKSKVNNLKSDVEKEAIKGVVKKKISFNQKNKEEKEVILNVNNQNYSNNILFEKSNSISEQALEFEAPSQSEKIENKEMKENIEIIEKIEKIEIINVIDKLDIENTEKIVTINETENMENNIPSKQIENSGGLIDINFEEITLHERKTHNINNDPLLVMSQIENNFSNLKRSATQQEVKNSLVSNLNTKKLIELNNYKEEHEIENENIIYKINKTSNEQEVNFISMNLLLKYIINKTVDEQLNATTTNSSINLIDLPKDFIIQHNVIISSTNLLELIKSFFNYYNVITKNNNNSAITTGLIFFLNNFLIFNFEEEIFSNPNIKQKLIQLYEIIEIVHQEIYFTNNSKNKIKISLIKEILKSDDLNETLGQINNLAE